MYSVPEKDGIGASDLLAKVGAFPVIYDGNAETDKDAVVHKTDGTISGHCICRRTSVKKVQDES